MTPEELRKELDLILARLRHVDNFEAQRLSFTAPASGEIEINHNLRETPSYFIMINDVYPLKRGSVWNKNKVSFELITSGTARDVEVLIFK